MGTCITVPMTSQQRQLLEAILRAPSSEQRLVFRARILLACATDPCNETVARACGTNRPTVRKWRRRWLAAQDTLATAEAGDEGAPSLGTVLMRLLQDAPRAGRPPTFTAEQLAQLVALACTRPPDVGREGTHWTPRELADELTQQQVVPSISPRHVGRFLKGGRP
jgi:putative transposase